MKSLRAPEIAQKPALGSLVRITAGPEAISPDRLHREHGRLSLGQSFLGRQVQPLSDDCCLRLALLHDVPPNSDLVHALLRTGQGCATFWLGPARDRAKARPSWGPGAAYSTAPDTACPLGPEIGRRSGHCAFGCREAPRGASTNRVFAPSMCVLIVSAAFSASSRGRVTGVSPGVSCTTCQRRVRSSHSSI